MFDHFSPRKLLGIKLRFFRVFSRLVVRIYWLLVFTLYYGRGYCIKVIGPISRGKIKKTKLFILYISTWYLRELLLFYFAIRQQLLKFNYTFISNLSAIQIKLLQFSSTVSDIKPPQVPSAVELTSTSNSIGSSCRVCPPPPWLPGFFERHAI